MKKIPITLDQALLLIKQGKFDRAAHVKFGNKKVSPPDALTLGENGVNVPEKLIDYDDTMIDFTDIPEITNEDISSGKIKWTISAEIPLDKEIQDWIKHENIDVNTFVSRLIRNFYENIKSLPKKAAM